MNKVTGFLVGLLCGALLVVGILAFNQNSFASYYDIDDVMSKLDSIESKVDSVAYGYDLDDIMRKLRNVESTVSSIESDVSYIKFK